MSTSSSSSNNEILNRILELCEDNMNEGEYLKSSKLLKTVSEKNPDTSLTKTNRIIEPIRINIGGITMFITGYFERRHNIHCEFNMTKVLFKINNHEIQAGYESGFSNSFRDVLKTIIKSEMALEINIFDFLGIDNNVKCFSFDNFRDFFSELNEEVYGLELYYEYADFVSKFISEYLSNIVKELKNEPNIS